MEPQVPAPHERAPSPDDATVIAGHVARRAIEVLVVEDEHLVALDLQEHLQALGHHVVVAYSGEAAIDRARATAFDLILMDIKLGAGIDGIDAARAIRELADVPIIYVTAYADSHTLDRARLTEPYGYILKPFDERELHAAIEMALQRHGTDARRAEEATLQTFLAHASARLASTLDYVGILRAAAELVVPRYADWCLIALDPVDPPLAATFLVYPDGETPRAWLRQGPGGLLEGVIREQRSTVLGADARALGELLGVGHLEVPALGACSLMCLPLGGAGGVAGTRALGAFAIAIGHARHRAGALTWAEDFVHRLGMALENALSYQRAQQALQMRNEVLAMVSHDLRNPLNAIILRARSLAHDTKAAPAANAILIAARRMDRMVGDLLDASAINVGHLSLDVRSWPARELADEAVQLLQPDAEAAGIALASEVASDAPLVRCDRARVLQVLTNLIGNALRFTPQGGAITITAAPRRDMLAIAVADTGSGIPAEQLPLLFERFWRGDHSHPGAGLGLYVCRGIVESHGGQISVESSVGVGSTFTFTLPRSREAAR